MRAAIASKDFATRKKLVRGWLRASGESDFRVQLDHGISAVWAEGRPQPHRILAAPFSIASWPIGTAHRSAAPWYVLSYAPIISYGIQPVTVCTQIQERSATLPKDAAGQGSTVRHVVRHGSDPCPELLPSQSARGGAGWFLRLPLAVWGLKEGRIVSTQSLPWPEFAAFNVGPIPIPLTTCRQKGADAPAARGLHEDVPGVLQAAVARRPGSVLELAGEVTLNYGHHTAEPSPLLF